MLPLETLLGNNQQRSRLPPLRGEERINAKLQNVWLSLLLNSIYCKTWLGAPQDDHMYDQLQIALLLMHIWCMSIWSVFQRVCHKIDSDSQGTADANCDT